MLRVLQLLRATSVATALSVANADAQSSAVKAAAVDLNSALTAGEHVRVSAPALGSRKQVARIVSVNANAIVVQLDSGGKSRELLASELLSVERSAGKRTNGLRGMGVGLIAGLGIGAMSFMSGDSGDFFFSHNELVAMGALVGGAGGAVVGGIIGTYTITDRWVPVERTRWTSRVSLAMPAMRSAGLHIAF